RARVEALEEDLVGARLLDRAQLVARGGGGAGLAQTGVQADRVRGAGEGRDLRPDLGVGPVLGVVAPGGAGRRAGAGERVRDDLEARLGRGQDAVRPAASV